MSKLTEVLKHLINGELKEGVSANRTYNLQVALDLIAEIEDGEKPATVAPQKTEIGVEEKSKKKEKSDV